MEGKRAEWEGVVKVPFISESRLLGGSGKCTAGAVSGPAGSGIRSSHGSSACRQLML